MAVMEPITESIFPDKPVVYAKFGARFVAWIVDGVFVLLAMFMVVQFMGSSPIGGVINLLIILLYCPLMEAGPRQATLGKTGMNIKVTNLEGERITHAQAFGRHLGKIVSIVILLAGYFMMLWDNKNQTLHDRMAGTLVVMRQGR